MSGYQDSNLGPPAPKAGALTGLLSGYQDSNLGPPAPKAGALTGLRYTPKAFFQKRCKGKTLFSIVQIIFHFFSKKLREKKFTSPFPHSLQHLIQKLTERFNMFCLLLSDANINKIFY